MANAIGPLSKYKPEYCEAVIEHMKKGLSFESFAGVVGVHRDTLYEWSHRHPEFSDAKKKAEVVCQLWWELKGIAGMHDPKGFNGTIWMFNMKCRFGWKDGSEQGKQTVSKVDVTYATEYGTQTK